MNNYSRWQQNNDLFKGRNYRAKSHDTQAVVLTRKNANLVARVCNGTAIITPYEVMVKFIGIHGPEFVLEDQYLVRTIVPGSDYYSAMSPEMFLKHYEPTTHTTIPLGDNDEDAEVQPEVVSGRSGSGDAGELRAGEGVVRRRAVPGRGKAGPVLQG